MIVAEHDIRHLKHVVVIGGTGAVGNLFCERLAGLPQIHVTSVDLTPENEAHEPITYIQSDICYPDRRLKQMLGKADVVILAVPENIALACLPVLARAMKSNSLLVDTLSVKTAFVDAVAKSRDYGEVLSINPMFAPSMSFERQSVACIEVRTGRKTQTFLYLMRSWGADIVMVSHQEHDRLTAALQTLTHAAILAFGLSLKKLSYDLHQATKLMPPPHRTMLCLMARMTEADSEVYRDIQHSNPHAAAVREMLSESIDRISRTVDQDESKAFADLIDDLREVLDGHQKSFSKQCHAMFGKFGENPNSSSTHSTSPAPNVLKS
jgi:prephenate dehydrogenase